MFSFTFPRSYLFTLLGLLGILQASVQGDLVRLKSRTIDTSVMSSDALHSGKASAEALLGDRYLLVQLAEGRVEQTLTGLKNAGVTILGAVPDRAVSVFVPAGVQISGIEGVEWIGTLTPDDKLSAFVHDLPGTQHVIAHFHPNVTTREIGQTVSASGAKRLMLPSLPLHIAFLEADQAQIDHLVRSELVAYLQPSSKAMLTGEAYHYCPGVRTQAGFMAPFVTFGDGWDGPGLGSADLTYYFSSNRYPGLSNLVQRGLIEDAMEDWAEVAALTFTRTFSRERDFSLDIGFYSEDENPLHTFFGPEDPTLAVAFFPNDLNPEPVAGDILFNEDQPFTDSTENFSLFAVALHELGHSLGMGHTDDETAVMFAFYSPHTELQPDDIAGIQSIYAAIDDGGPDRYEPDNTFGTAKSLRPNSTQPKNLRPVGDQDWNFFTLTEETQVRIQTRGEAGDTVLRLYDENLSIIATDDDGGSGRFSLLTATLQAGTYYTEVEEFGNNAEIDSYTITLFAVSGDADVFEPDDERSMANDLEPSFPRNHSIVPAWDADYFTFSLTSLSEITLITNGDAGGDTVLWLFNESGAIVEFNDDGGDGLYSRIDRTATQKNRLAPGKYYALVTDNGGDDIISNYSILLSVVPLYDGDAYEPNNDDMNPYVHASDWEGIPLSASLGLGVMDTDPDYYEIEVGPENDMTVEARLYYQQSEGDLSLSLIKGDGANTILGESDTDADNEFLRVEVGAAGTYQLKVSRSGGGTNHFGYDLVWEDFTEDEIESPSRRTVWDFDGDGVTDYYNFEPSTGRWRIKLSGNGDESFPIWGDSSMQPVEGDFDGDGLADLGLYQERTGSWFIQSYDGDVIASPAKWGGRGLKPVSGDYNGDGKSDLALYQKSTGMWYIASLGESGPALSLILFQTKWGGPGMEAVSGDYNGDGNHDLAVYQKASGKWYIVSIYPDVEGKQLITANTKWGNASMTPYPGDYNGDGMHDLGLYQPNSGNWYILSIGPNGPSDPVISFEFKWGNRGLTPLLGDFDGDGAEDLVMFQKKTASWFTATAFRRLIQMGFRWGAIE